jgi:molecular chaperone GrpE
MQENANSSSEHNAQQNPETETEDAGATDAASSEVEQLQAKLKEAEQKYIYLYADFENFKKRAIKERQETIKFGWENVASSLLDVLDNLDRALQFAKTDTDPGLMSGLKMVSQQFKATMEKQGVAEIKSIDQSFNPELHEGVGQIPSDKPEGTIVQEAQKGYTLHGRLLRPSRVLISSGVAPH